MNDYIFIKRENKISVWWSVLAIVLCLVIVGYMEKRDMVNRQELKETRMALETQQNTNTHLWIMDSSCSRQLLNSKDGILRIKTK